MTTETQTIVDLCDIARIVFECAKCGARISTPFPHENMPAAVKCPSCHTNWENSGRQPYGDLLVKMEEQMKANAVEGTTFKLRLELRPPDPDK